MSLPGTWRNEGWPWTPSQEHFPTLPKPSSGCTPLQMMNTSLQRQLYSQIVYTIFLICLSHLKHMQSFSFQSRTFMIRECMLQNQTLGLTFGTTQNILQKSIIEMYSQQYKTTPYLTASGKVNAHLRSNFSPGYPSMIGSALGIFSEEENVSWKQATIVLCASMIQRKPCYTCFLIAPSVSHVGMLQGFSGTQLYSLWI